MTNNMRIDQTQGLGTIVETANQAEYFNFMAYLNNFFGPDIDAITAYNALQAFASVAVLYQGWDRDISCV